MFLITSKWAIKTWMTKISITCGIIVSRQPSMKQTRFLDRFSSHKKAKLWFQSLKILLVYQSMNHFISFSQIRSLGNSVFLYRGEKTTIQLWISSIPSWGDIPTHKSNRARSLSLCVKPFYLAHTLIIRDQYLY